MRKCCMLLMDATPIILLAKINRLSLLFHFNIPVYVPREVVFEVTRKRAFEQGGKQNNEELSIEQFIRESESAGKLFVVKTLVCEAAERKRAENPAYRSKGDGEVAANSLFLNRDSFNIHGPAVLLYEDADAEIIFRRDDVHFLTTYAMLCAMEKIGAIKSADEEWDELNLVYEAKNRTPLDRRHVDHSNRGDTEYRSRMEPK